MNTAASSNIPSEGDHSVSEALGLWEPKRTMTLDMARRHSVRIRFFRKVLIALAVALVGLVVWQFVSQPAGFDLDDNPEDSVRMISPRYSGRTSDNLPYYLTAGEAVREAGKANAVKLSGPVLDFYRAPGATVSKVISESGVYDDVDKVLELRGNVKLKTDDGYACETTQARIFARDKAIDGEEPIACVGGFGAVNGNAYDISDNYSVFTFKDGMSAVIERDEALSAGNDNDGGSRASAQLGFAGDSPIDVSAVQAVYQSAITTLSGDVDVTQDGTKITAENMAIDRAKASGPDAGSLKLGEITKIDARGNFVYVTPDRTVRGDRGVYERAKEIITVTGNVSLKERGGTTVNGNKLVYNLRTKTAQFGESCTGENCGRVTFGTPQQ